MHLSNLDFTTIFYKTTTFETSDKYYIINWYPYESRGEIVDVNKHTGDVTISNCSGSRELDKLLTEIPINEL